MTDKGQLLIGCVAEGTPKYLGQALRLLRSLRWFGGSVGNAPFVVCIVGDVDASYRQRFEALDARVRPVERFSTLHPQSNKLRFLEIEETFAADRVILLDCDTIVVRDPSSFLGKSHFEAKIADVRTVSHQTFERLFAAFGLPMPPCNQTSTVDNQPTIPYFNAGVLAFSRFAMQTLVPIWIRFNRQLIERLDLLGGESNFCEQASLSLALAASGVDFATLGNEMNFPAHFNVPVGSAFGRTDPVVIHYHWLVDEHGYLLPSPYPAVNRRIERFNARLRGIPA